MERGFGQRAVGWALMAIALVSLSAQRSWTAPDKSERDEAAPAAGPAPGYLIRVPLPITGVVDNRVKGMIQRALARLDTHGPRPVLVLEFARGGTEFGEGNDFSRALALARYLSSRQLAGVKTVAYIPESIKGHAVLVAMACEEIIMHPDAEIGEAGIDEPAAEAIDPSVLSGYKQIASNRRTIPVEVALGMLDKQLEVLKVETEVSVEYVLRDDLAALRKRTALRAEPEVLIRAGELGRFTGREARELGFVKYLAANRAAVAKALDLAPGSLREDPSLDRDWSPVQVKLEGDVNPKAVSRLQSTITKARAGEANFICLRIDSPGGSLADSMQLANFLAGLDRDSVRTVAYIPHEARGEAALIALACDHVVMHPDAVLGGEGLHPIAEDEVQPARETIRRELAAKKSRTWSLLAAVVDPKLPVHRYQHAKTGEVAYFCAAELAEQADPADWEKGEAVTREAAVLEISGTRAKELGLAWEVTDDFNGLKQLYGLADDPRLVEPSWVDVLVEALARPELAALLLVIGGVAVFVELHSPGMGVGGFVALVCFVLFFWSKFLVNTAEWLEVLLFLSGFCCLALEIFVLPGFGIFGLGGGLLIIVSLILASQTFILPHDDLEFAELRDSMLVVGGAAAGIIVVSALLRRYLPRAPIFNRLLLEPPDVQGLAELSARETIVSFDHLLGQQGVAATELLPSGKVQFGDQLVDVLSDGDVIDRGTRVVVVEARGNRVVVRAAPRT